MGAHPKLRRDLIDLCAANGGIISRQRCFEFGMSRAELHTLLRYQLLIRLAQGVYAIRADHDYLDPWERFTLATRAFLVASPPNCAAAGWSAVALLGLPHPLKPPAVPSVFRQGSRTSGSNRTPFGHTRFAAIDDRWIRVVDGYRCLDPAFAAVDLARTAATPWSLIVADAAASLTSMSQLRIAAADMTKWPSMKQVSWVVANADPDAESAVESAGRCALVVGGVEAPQSNVWIGIDRPQVRMDHYWARARLAAEGDGMGKYLLHGDPRTGLRAEKDREHLLQAMGIRTIRYDWARATRDQHVLVRQAQLALSQPPLPRVPGVRTWSAAEGFEILGMTRKSRAFADQSLATRREWSA